MVICIVMHSDFLSDDDSDSSSISSSTVVTSASDDDDDDSLPSSAFEDEDDFKKECLRWKAPELLINKKMGATKESVAFSIGMMLWECLTLQIPFGEYEAEVAGQKIVNGERPDLRKVLESSYAEVLHHAFFSSARQPPNANCNEKGVYSAFPSRHCDAHSFRCHRFRERKRRRGQHCHGIKVLVEQQLISGIFSVEQQYIIDEF
ncbi:uncharacterized protein MONOS_17704 [Monocercomonoides exilis]|uniref:uncharacterized protein n=1 Tax=Monocercomonoides exilis TaxID=2049356 RepID=UPI00355AA9BC|nr:hypothetical protein MONOS_17704 [Monocercomonoides exilis]